MEKEMVWVCLFVWGRTSPRTYQDVEFQGTPKGSSPFRGKSLPPFLLVCMPSFYFLPPFLPSSFFVFSFAGLAPTPSSSYSNIAPPCDVHFYSLARLQGRRNTVRPARKWRNYIREQEGEEEGRVNHDGEEATGRARLRRGVLASAENTVQKRVSRTPLPPTKGKDENFKRAKGAVFSLATFLLFRRIIFRIICLVRVIYVLL